MRQREVLTIVAALAVLGFCCVLLNTIVQGQRWAAHPELPDGSTISDPSDTTAYSRSLADDILARRNRKKVLGVVGVQTGFSRRGATIQYNYERRRQALRASWFPDSQQALDEFEKKTGLVVRFVIGHSADQGQEKAVAKEAEEHGGFLRLPLQEAYTSLTEKTLAFLGAVTNEYLAEYIVKVDDDVWLRIDRLPFAFKQWDEVNADYIGCMKTGEIMRDKRYRWFEPQYEVLGGSTYFTHAWGSLYAVSGRIAAILSRVHPGTLRFFSNEDVTVGSWMLAFNTTHMDDRRLCMSFCAPASIGVYDMPLCAGLCDAVKTLPEMQANDDCTDPSVYSEESELPRIRPIFLFQREDW